MQVTKTQIVVVSVIVVILILWNFWYYLHQSPKVTNSWNPIVNTSSENNKKDSTISDVPKNTVSGQKPNTPTDEEPNNSSNESSSEKLGQAFTDTSWGGNLGSYSNYWGNENVTMSAGGMKVAYPKGSNAPSNTPRGGAGFIYNFPTAYHQLSLSYTLKFEDGFDFVKGGKLPGLCGGNCSRGSNMPTESGFSIRFVWKKNGYLDTMNFLPNTPKPGNYTGVKMFKFESGKEYTLTMQLRLNDVGVSNGTINVLVDGKNVYTKNDVTLRVSDDVKISSLFFSTFFGGKDDSYSSTKDTSIDFRDFKISETF